MLVAVNKLELSILLSKTLREENLQDIVTAGIESIEINVRSLKFLSAPAYEYQCQSNNNGGNEKKYPNLNVFSINERPSNSC